MKKIEFSGASFHLSKISLSSSKIGLMLCPTFFRLSYLSDPARAVCVFEFYLLGSDMMLMMGAMNMSRMTIMSIMLGWCELFGLLLRF